MAEERMIRGHKILTEEASAGLTYVTSPTVFGLFLVYRTAEGVDWTEVERCTAWLRHLNHADEKPDLPSDGFSGLAPGPRAYERAEQERRAATA